MRKGAFDEKDNVKRWEITEPLNFCEQGMGFQWYWHYFGHEEGRVDFYRKMEEQFDNFKAGTAQEVLEKNAIKSTFDEEKARLGKELEDAKKEGGSDLYLQMEIEGVERALEHLDTLSQADIELLSKVPHSHREPPVLFEFCVGEHPTLPVFGRHLKNCNSKWLTGSHEVIQAIFNILHRHFPENVVRWSDCNEDYHYKRYFRSAPGEAEGMAAFYRKLEEQFDNFKRAGTAQEFRMARKTFAGIQ